MTLACTARWVRTASISTSPNLSGVKEYEMFDPVQIGRNRALAITTYAHIRFNRFEKGGITHDRSLVLETCSQQHTPSGCSINYYQAAGLFYRTFSPVRNIFFFLFNQLEADILYQKIKGRLLIIIMRPKALLTCCYASKPVSPRIVKNGST